MCREPSLSLVYLSGQTLGISEGVNIEAFDFYGSDILFSVDVPVVLDGRPFTEKDIILYDGSTFSKILNGADVGIPEGAQIDAATMLPDREIIFSLDIPTLIDGMSVTDKDFIEWDGTSFSLPFTDISANLPQEADVDALAVADWCHGDNDHDRDVDGEDLADYIFHSDGLGLDVFANNFGRVNCP